MTHQPRPEHPRPQFFRPEWRNLNGTWTCSFDTGRSGLERGFPSSTGFDQAIVVPFCPESALSGLGHRDFIEAFWYHRQLSIPAEWTDQRVLLHFGAVDYECEAYIDGVWIGHHVGGTVSFTFDITSVVQPGQTHQLVLHVRDELRSHTQPGGKQSPAYHSHRCYYTRTTGIWQTVWLESVPHSAVEAVQILPDVDNPCFAVCPTFSGLRQGMVFTAKLFAGDKLAAEQTVTAANATTCLLPLEQPQLWCPEQPHLYRLELQLSDRDGVLCDQVESYAGLRKVHLEDGRVWLNNEPCYLRLVLDQGFYPDGIWTAPSDAALKQDIVLAQKAGFNGARLHQKVFEERFHYWADKLGYLTWGESASWGLNMNEPVSARNFLSEWREIVQRDRNHPSLIAWTPFNETRDVQEPRHHHRLQRDAYDLTAALDPTRPINDASGYVHVKTDIWTVHNYEQDPQKLHDALTPTATGAVFRNVPDQEVRYQGQPYIIDEFGGIRWIADPSRRFAEDSWGYGQEPKSLEEFFERLAGLIKAIRSLEHICGFCYTQLTDVEQEQNGIYHYDRSEKFASERIAAIITQTE